MIRRGGFGATVLAALALAPAASAQTTKCRGNRYLVIQSSGFPGIRNERAINLPRRTSGYAPRCLVADSIASGIQYFWSQHQRLPHSLPVHGARWDAGVWQLQYTVRHVKAEPAVVYRHLVARHGRQRVTMDLVS